MVRAHRLVLKLANEQRPIESTAKTVGRTFACDGRGRNSIQSAARGSDSPFSCLRGESWQRTLCGDGIWWRIKAVAAIGAQTLRGFKIKTRACVFAQRLRSRGRA